MSDQRNRLWAAYCRQMAEMTYKLADWCDDAELMQAYIALGARWVNRGIDGPKREGELDLATTETANLLAA
jgi:hypothetical protein